MRRVRKTVPLHRIVSVWRWHVTMASSIIHRVTGVGLYGAAIGVGDLAHGGRSSVQKLTRSSIPSFRLGTGRLAMYLVVAALAYHLANGIRHLVFDTGAGLTPADADTSAWFAILFAIAAPIGMWALLTFGA